MLFIAQRISFSDYYKNELTHLSNRALSERKLLLSCTIFEGSFVFILADESNWIRNHERDPQQKEISSPAIIAQL